MFLPRRASVGINPAMAVYPRHVTQYAIDVQVGIRGDLAHAEFRLQAAVETGPPTPRFRFIRSFHPD